MTRHLGDLGSALVDNQLSLTNQEKALAHLARCPRCAHEVAAIRTARRLLNTAPDIPAPSTDLLGSLLALDKDGPGGVLDKAGPVGGFRDARCGEKFGSSPFLESEFVPKGNLNGDIQNATGFKKHWPKYVAGLAVGALCAGAYTLGGRPVITPHLTAAATQQHLNRTNSTFDFMPVIAMSQNTQGTQVSGIDHAKLSDWLSAHQFSVPRGLPESVRVMRAGFISSDPGVLEIVFDTEVGTVVVTETYGQLNVNAVSGLPSIAHFSGPIYVASDAPTHLVWQSGENVMELSSPAAISDIGEMINGFAVTPSDTGMKDRLARGLTQMTGVIR